MRIARLMIVGLLAVPSVMLPQTKVELQSIQRDVAQLTEQIKNIKDAQTQQTAALTALLQQTLDESRKANAAATALQHSLDQRLGDLQTRLAGPVATLGTKVDQMSGDLGSVQTSFAELNRLVRKLDEKLTDIKTAVTTLNQPQAPPPGATDPSKPQVPAGLSAETLYPTAYRDYSGGKESLALQEFADYLKYFPDTANAPAAQFYMGQIYDHAKQYDDAVQAFDAVLKYPENSRTGDAFYMKGVVLLKAQNKPEALKVFREFVDRYPTHASVVAAKGHIRELTATPARSNQKKKGSQ
jgi:TolA-binding protein